MKPKSFIWPVLFPLLIRISAGLDISQHKSTTCANPDVGLVLGESAFVCNPNDADPVCLPFEETYGRGPNCVVECPNGKDEECEDGYTKCDKCKCVKNVNACLDRYWICPHDYFKHYMCSDGATCIAEDWIGDGYPDCPSEEDENECSFPERYPCADDEECVELAMPLTYECRKKACPARSTEQIINGERKCIADIDIAIAQCTSITNTNPFEGTMGIQCGNGTCLPLSKYRDCNVDCDDGIDESCYPGLVKCDGCKCVRPEAAKDACLENTLKKLCLMDEQPYDYNIYHCADGNCILWEWIEDHDPDCADDEDEKCLLEPCVDNAYCAFVNTTERLYQCKCLPGFFWTGYSCEKVTTTAVPTTTTTTTSTTTTTPTTTTTSTTTTPTTTTTTPTTTTPTTTTTTPTTTTTTPTTTTTTPTTTTTTPTTTTTSTTTTTTPTTTTTTPTTTTTTPTTTTTTPTTTTTTPTTTTTTPTTTTTTPTTTTTTPTTTTTTPTTTTTTTPTTTTTTPTTTTTTPTTTTTSTTTTTPTTTTTTPTTTTTTPTTTTTTPTTTTTTPTTTTTTPTTTTTSTTTTTPTTTTTTPTTTTTTPTTTSTTTTTTTPTTTTTTPTTTTTTPTTTTTTPTTTTTTPTTTTTTPTTTTTTTTPTTTTTTTTPTTTTTSTTTTTTPTTTTTTTTLATTSTPTGRPLPIYDYRTTLGFLIDSTASTNPFKDQIKNHIKLTVDDIEKTWPGRFANYLLGPFDTTGTSVASHNSPTEYKKAVDLWNPLTANDNGETCPNRTLLQSIKDSLDQALQYCTITVITSGPPADYTAELWQEVLLLIMDRKCQLHVIKHHDGNDCFDENDPKTKALTELAVVSNGNLLVINPTTEPDTTGTLTKMFSIIKGQAECVRYVLDAGSFVSPGTVYRRVAVDAETLNITVTVASCQGTDVEIRDDRGIWLTPSWGYWVDLLKTPENRAVSIINIARAWKFHEASGPGQWVIKITGNGCPIHYRVTGSGGSDYKYAFTFNPIDDSTYNLLPALGVPSKVRADLEIPQTTSYIIDKVELMKGDGATATVSRMNVGDPGDPVWSKDYIQAQNGLFYVKISSFLTVDYWHPQVLAFQRFSATMLMARPLGKANLMPAQSKCGLHEFYCGTRNGADVCIGIEKFRTGFPQCSTGLDEACYKDFYKCEGVCIEASKNCTPTDLVKLCSDLEPQEIFKCQNGGCVPKQWLMDEQNDCGQDNSDDDPAYINECDVALDECAPEAYCTNIVDSSYYCTCRQPHRGDGFDCGADPNFTTSTPPSTSVGGSTTAGNGKNEWNNPNIDPVKRSLFGSRCTYPMIDCLEDPLKCIDFSKRLDGVADCANGVDEQCLEGYDYCDNGKCVLKAKANTACVDLRIRNECMMGDEAGYYQCQGSSECIIYQWAMDGTDDCPDGSDENPLLWDECVLGKHSCDANAQCSDNVTVPIQPSGVHICTCKFGYKGDGNSCQPLTP